MVKFRQLNKVNSPFCGDLFIGKAFGFSSLATNGGRIMKNAFTIDYATAWLMGIDLVATGRQLKQHRLALHLTQEDLSDFFDQVGDSASRVIISMWENGKKLPTLSHVVLLAQLYHCPVDELVITFMRSAREAEGEGGSSVLLWIFLQDHRRRDASCGGLFC